MGEILFSSQYFTVENDRQGVMFVGSGDAVGVVPVLETGEALLAVEPSAAFDEPVLVLCTGEVTEGEPLAATANRELQEELGLKARDLVSLGEIHPWAKYLRARVHLFLARDLVPSRLEGDEDYEIGIERVSFDDVEAMVGDGRLRDANSIAGLVLARSFLRQE